MSKEKKFVRGFFNESKFGFNIKLHKDAIAAIKDGSWAPVGEYYQISVGKKRDGSGYFMAEDDWAPSKPAGSTFPSSAGNWSKLPRAVTHPNEPTNDDNSLPF